METLRFGVVGNFQAGKSTLINCLIGSPMATIGDGSSTTHVIVNYQYGTYEHIECVDYDDNHILLNHTELKRIDTNNKIKKIYVYLNVSFLKNIILTDMPGFGNNQNDNVLSDKILKKIDFAIVIQTNYKVIEENSYSYKIIERLKWHNVPYYFILNCVEPSKKDWKWTPFYNKNIELAFENIKRLNFYKPLIYPFEEDKPLVVNLLWYWYAISNDNDELISRYQDNFKEYNDLTRFDKNEISKFSNFEVVKKIFSMENRAYLELRKYLKEEIQHLRDELCPVGTIQSFAFIKEQESWLVCDGRTLDIEEYPELFNAIGFTFGGNNYTKFKIPDLRGRFVRGWSKQGELDHDREFGSLQEDAFQGHSHYSEFSSSTTSYAGVHHHEILADGRKTLSGESHARGVISTAYYDLKGGKTTDNGSHCHELPEIIIKDPVNSTCGIVKTSDETRPKNIALLYFIKATGTNNFILNNSPRAEVDLKDLYVSENGCQYEGFVILTSEFSLKYNGNLINDNICIETLNGINDEPVYLSKTNKSDHLKTSEKGLHYLKYVYTGKHENGVQITNLTLVRIKSIGIIGDFNSWKESIEMTSDASDLRYSCTLKMNKNDKFKFRANNEWGIELDGDLSSLSPHKSKDLICNESGMYDIILDIHSQPWHCEIIKKENIDETSDRQTEDSAVKPSDPELDINKIFGQFNFKF